MHENRSITQTEQKHSERVERPEDERDDKNTKDQDQSAPSDNVASAMLLAGLIPQTVADGQHESPPPLSGDAATAANATADGSQSVTAVESSSVTPQSLPIASQGTGSVDPQQAAAPTPAEGAGNRVGPSINGAAKAPDSPVAESNIPEAMLLTEGENPATADVDLAMATDSSPTAIHAEPDTNHSTAAVTASHVMPKSSIDANGINHSDLQSPFESVARATDVSAGHGTSGMEQSFNQGQTSPESGNNSEHTKPNPLPPDDHTLRPQFLDQAAGVSPSAPPAVEGRVGRGETGQTAVIHGAERNNDLPGGLPSTQTVTLDLDPLDMGPLRVRIMMTEQTIHTHIRTEHGELGQGLLQQGPSLEASLRTTGFEMGTLRVTVDQQQQGRGEHPWTFQQQQNRSEVSSGQSAAAAESERADRIRQDIDKNGRVSWFA